MSFGGRSQPSRVLKIGRGWDDMTLHGAAAKTKAVEKKALADDWSGLAAPTASADPHCCLHSTLLLSPHFAPPRFAYLYLSSRNTPQRLLLRLGMLQ